LTSSKNSDKIYEYYRIMNKFRGALMTETTQIEQLTLTENAARAVRDLLESRDLEDYGLRVFVSGGGCGGYQYGMSLDNSPIESDTISKQHGVKILIDDISILYLQGATIDYQDNETGTGFKIDNPNNIASSCGCGGTSPTTGCGCGSGGCGC
jgi:iron-sulfur cluster assembly protein